MNAELQIVKINYVDMHLERPPKIRLYFDMELYNAKSERRWFLLPDLLKSADNQEPIKDPYAIDMVEVYQFNDQGRVVVGHFSGSHGFQALLLPAGARVTLRRFPILFWGQMPVSIPYSVKIEVVVASQLDVGDKSIFEWFEINPESDAIAEVLAEALQDQSEVLAVNETPDNNDVSVNLHDQEFYELIVGIGFENDN